MKLGGWNPFKSHLKTKAQIIAALKEAITKYKNTSTFILRAFWNIFSIVFTWDAHDLILYHMKNGYRLPKILQFFLKKLLLKSSEKQTKMTSNNK